VLLVVRMTVLARDGAVTVLARDGAVTVLARDGAVTVLTFATAALSSPSGQSEPTLQF
jgi:hypothetical protein